MTTMSDAYRIFLDTQRSYYTVVPIFTVTAFDTAQHAFEKANREMEELAYQMTDSEDLGNAEERLRERGLTKVSGEVLHPAFKGLSLNVQS